MKLANTPIQSARLELTTNCQLNCVACPTANGVIGRSLGSGSLSASNFAKFIELNPDTKNIELSNWGEPFLNKEFLAFLSIANSKNIQLSIDNGANINYIDENVIEGIIKYKLNRITCSIDGATNEIYAKYRRGGNLSVVLDNIKK